MNLNPDRTETFLGINDIKLIILIWKATSPRSLPLQDMWRNLKTIKNSSRQYYVTDLFLRAEKLRILCDLGEYPKECLRWNCRGRRRSRSSSRLRWFQDVRRGCPYKVIGEKKGGDLLRPRRKVTETIRSIKPKKFKWKNGEKVCNSFSPLFFKFIQFSRTEEPIYTIVHKTDL